MTDTADKNDEADEDLSVDLAPMTDEEKESIPMVTLFRLNGVEHQIPDRPRPNVAMQYLYLCRTRGIGMGESWLAETLLGKESYEALLGFDDLKQEQSNAIFAHARAVVFGQKRPKAEKEDSTSKKAPRKRQSRKPKTDTGS